ncbi:MULTISPECIES: DUF4359 domain-containing protein [Aphanothece]|uniref:DUF4359 domain-containing protein n=1 Tax=Aphanothece TaxID=1121 RepID=UPI00398554B0
MYQPVLRPAAAIHPFGANLAQLSRPGSGLTSAAPSPWHSPWLGGTVLLAVAAGALAWSNPDPAEFADYAAGRLVGEISREFCDGDALPTMLRLALPNCRELVASQRQAIGAVVSQQTRRTNLGLLSVYQSDLGGQRVLSWQVPRYSTTVVGIAGQFILVRGGESAP